MVASKDLFIEAHRIVRAQGGSAATYAARFTEALQRLQDREAAVRLEGLACSRIMGSIHTAIDLLASKPSGWEAEAGRLLNRARIEAGILYSKSGSGRAEHTLGVAGWLWASYKAMRE